MSDPIVKLQIDVQERTRRRLKVQAAEYGLDMGLLGDTLLDYCLGLLTQEKAPAEMRKLIERAKAEKAKRDQAEAD